MLNMAHKSGVALQHVLVQGFYLVIAPQFGAANAEIKDPSVENPELKDSPFLNLEQVRI